MAETVAHPPPLSIWCAHESQSAAKTSQSSRPTGGGSSSQPVLVPRGIAELHAILRVGLLVCYIGGRLRACTSPWARHHSLSSSFCISFIMRIISSLDSPATTRPSSMVPSPPTEAGAAAGVPTFAAACATSSAAAFR
eukprot:scaffold171949_cov27-Tisochrysis_lutea.AAC.3